MEPGSCNHGVTAKWHCELWIGAVEEVGRALRRQGASPSSRVALFEPNEYETYFEVCGHEHPESHQTRQEETLELDLTNA
jgi:hypothetical protein